MRNRQARLQIRDCILSLKCFSIEELCAHSDVSRSAVQRYVRELLEQGVLEVIKQRSNGSKGGDLYHLVRNPLLPKHMNNQQAGRSQIWEVIRILQIFQLSSLLACSNVSYSNAKKYVHYLLQAGYLRVLKPRVNGSKTCNVYCLIRNSGPIAPVVQQNHAVFDPNLKEIYLAK